jgi:hypothetical protein
MNGSIIIIDRLDDYEREYDDITQKDNDICMYMFRFIVFLSFLTSALLVVVKLRRGRDQRRWSKGSQELKQDMSFRGGDQLGRR